MSALGRYRYEHIFIDSSSTGGTIDAIKRIAASDSNVKLIVNARNFGHDCSPIHGVYQASGRRR
jgi:glycosyltransferase involved in cell wall biosynthesis